MGDRLTFREANACPEGNLSPAKPNR